METKQKKVEVEIDGKLHRVMPHMLKDVMKFGGSVVRRTLKDAPKELSVIPLPKKLILPKAEPEKPFEIKPLEAVVAPELLVKTDYPSEIKEIPDAPAKAKRAVKKTKK